MRDNEFTLEMEEEEEEAGLYESLLVDVNRVLEKLKIEKSLLKQQQEGLKATFDIMTQVLKGIIFYIYVYSLCIYSLSMYSDFYPFKYP